MKLSAFSPDSVGDGFLAVQEQMSVGDFLAALLVSLAAAAAAAGKQKAVARFDAGELGGIVNRTIKPGSGDWVGIGVGRLSSLKKANNATRDAFMKAVADMFGGENRIPDSVRRLP